ncbi:MAG: hypothetical protein EBZ49_14750 [Proteobacteria bacterium]|nr:hypothetical protein [Pseudomonadota bacterium]
MGDKWTDGREITQHFIDLCENELRNAPDIFGLNRLPKRILMCSTPSAESNYLNQLFTRKDTDQ